MKGEINGEKRREEVSREGAQQERVWKEKGERGREGMSTWR